MERLDVNEVSDYLGVCNDTIYTMVKRGEIPHFRLRRRIMFTKKSLDEWVKKQEQESVVLCD